MLPLPASYLKLLFGLLISKLGDALYTFAIPWISYRLTDSVVVMGSMFVMGVLPVVIFGPFVGVAVDRWDKRIIMIIADISRLVLVSLIPIFQLLGVLQLWHLFTISFILSALSLLFDVATVSSIPDIVGSSLTKANSAYQFINQLVELIGPVVAGIIVGAIGGIQTLWLDVASFLVIIFITLNLPKKRFIKTSSQKFGFFQDMSHGFSWLVKDRLNLSLSLQAMVGNFGASSVLAVFMYYLLGELQLNSSQSGVNYSMIGIGGLIGSLIAVPLEDRFRRGLLIPILLGTGALGLLIAIAGDFWLAPGIALGVTMICNSAWNSLVASIRQETVPADLLGRVLGISRMFTRLAMPLGAYVGILMAKEEPAMVFVLAASTKGVEVIIALVTPIKKL
ncbi:MFS transporter [Bacillus sp. 1P10SD]|uniref:MFS transporter n=1 Tax=Bacillus sp. 1P10SD TaxID=3132265 RepID=UPI0039A62649